MSEDRDKDPKNQRRVYVLPSELVERIVEFQKDKNLPSEVEAVRRLLDEALKFRDEPKNVIQRFRDALQYDRIPSSVAKEVLVGHPQVTRIDFDERDAVVFNFRNHGLYRIDANGNAFDDANSGGYGETEWRNISNEWDSDDEIPF